MDIMHLVERSLYYLVDNSHFVIQVTIFVIVVLVVIYLFNLIVSGNDSSEGLSKKDISELETRIKTVLEQATHVTSSKPAAENAEGESSEGAEAASGDGETSGAAQASKEVLEQIETLKKEVEQKEAELQEMKESSSMGGGLSEEESKKYMDKINELEAKLQEYEIIEDEIADLSHFKEENERLKKQLEDIQAGGGAAAPQAEAPSEDSKSDTEETSETTNEPESQEAPQETAEQEAGEQTAQEDAETPAEDTDGGDQTAAEDTSNETENEESEEPQEASDSSDSDDLMAQAAAMLGEQGEEEPKSEDAPAAEEKKPEEAATEESSAYEAQAQAESMLKSGQDPDKTEEEYITKDVIDDFNQAVKEDVYGIKEDEAQATSEDSDSESEAQDDGLITDDLLAEFSKQLEPEMNAQVEETEKQAQSSAEAGEESSGEEDVSEPGLIDTEKMMQEMEELKELPEEDSSISALEEETDIEKMASEAGKLSSDS